MESSEVYTTNVSVDQAISRVNDVYEIEGLRLIIDTPVPTPTPVPPTGSTFILWGSTWEEQVANTFKAIVADADKAAATTALATLGSGVFGNWPATAQGEDGPHYGIIHLPSTTKLTIEQLSELIEGLENLPNSFVLGRVDLVTDVGDLEVKQSK